MQAIKAGAHYDKTNRHIWWPGGISSATARLLQAGGHEIHLARRSKDKLTTLSSGLKAGYRVGDVVETSGQFQ